MTPLTGGKTAKSHLAEFDNVDLKQALLDLGNRMVERHGFKPAQADPNRLEAKSMSPVLWFLYWLDQTPEARQELEQMGFYYRPSRRPAFQATLP